VLSPRGEGSGCTPFHEHEHEHEHEHGHKIAHRPSMVFLA
jgi:hypothetical protein